MSHQRLPYPEVSLPSLHTDVGVTEHRITALFTVPLTLALHETTGGNHGTS